MEKYGLFQDLFFFPFPASQLRSSQLSLHVIQLAFTAVRTRQGIHGAAGFHEQDDNAVNEVWEQLQRQAADAVLAAAEEGCTRSSSAEEKVGNAAQPGWMVKGSKPSKPQSRRVVFCAAL